MSKKESNTIKSTNKLLIPIILLMGFIPVIVHMYQYDPNMSQFDWCPANSTSQVDFFFAWKMIAIIAVGIVMAGIMLYRFLKKKDTYSFENSFYLLFIYAMFVAMSALFSAYKYWVVRGIYELFEPVWVVFVYMLLCYYAYNYVREEKQLKLVLGGAGIGMTIVTLIGVFQYFGRDFFKTGLGKHLITNSSWWSQLEQLSFNLPDGTSYTTLYNPNFLSFYFGMLIPLLVCLFVAAKKVWQRILLVVAEVLCVICLKGSGSDSGWMAVVIGGVIVALVLLSRKKKAFYVSIAIVIIGGIAAITVGTRTTVGARIKDTIAGTYYMNDRFAIREIKTGEENAMLNIRGNELYVSFGVDENGIVQPSCADSDGNLLAINQTDTENQIYTISDARFEGVSVQPILLGEGNTPALSVNVDGIAWNFICTEDDGYRYCNPAGKAVKCDTVKSAELFKADAMSSRGHIWNLTIPLLGKHVLVGSGANTYMLEFPQDDYIGQMYMYGANNYQVKAHCWYLQQWVETGLLGTLALLIFIGWYIVKSIRIYRQVNLHESMSWIGFGLFAAVVVYLIAAVANDSNVCTAPVFWAMLGLGMAANRILTEKNQLFVKVTEESDKEQKPEQKTDFPQSQNTNKKKTSNKKQSRKQRKNQKSN